MLKSSLMNTPRCLLNEYDIHLGGFVSHVNCSVHCLDLKSFIKRGPSLFCFCILCYLLGALFSLPHCTMDLRS